MKRLPMLLAILLLLSACGENAGEASKNPAPSDTQHPVETPLNLNVSDGYEDEFTYPTHDITTFTMDENGIVYVAGNARYDDSFFEVGEDGNRFLAEGVSMDDLKSFATVSAYDLTGSTLAEYEIETKNSIEHMCVGGGKLFYASFSAWVDGVQNDTLLYSYDLETREPSKLEFLTEMFNLPSAVKKLAHLDGKLYILGILEDYITEEYDIGQTREGSDQVFYDYKYDGRILAAYDVQNDTFEIVFHELIETFTLTPDGKIMISARDPEANDGWGASYFQEMNPDTMSLGDRVYHGIQYITTFATDGYGVMYDANAGALTAPPGSLKYCSLGEDTGEVNMSGGGGMSGSGVSREADAIQYYDGFTFYLGSDSDGRKLHRIRNSIKITLPIRIIGANVYDEIPTAKQNVRFKTVPYDEFALSVLSGGAAYDIAYIGARQDFAYNIRDKGAFYALNDVPGVREYLDACFPYVKDAATDKNGDVWMLPISLNVDAILYQEENCKAAGIDFAGARTADDIIAHVKTAEGYNPGAYRFITTPFIQKNLLRYTRGDAALDTPAFRDLAASLKDFAKERADWGSGDWLVSEPDFLFDNFSSQTSQQIIGRNDLSIIPVTGSDGVNSADCAFLCVNSDSDQLEQTLEYISAVCESLMTKKDARMFKKSPAFTGSAYSQRLYDLYANATIDFNLSDEVFADVFDRYLNDEISLDEMIQEADRKLAMYRGE